MRRAISRRVYALFAVYGEQQRPDLAARCYARSLASIGVTTALA